MKRASSWLVPFAAIGLLGSVMTASAQDAYPSRGVSFTLGFGPGSGIDSNARMLAPFIEKHLGQTVTVINQPGGGSVPWANGLVRTAPDGYTFGMVGFPLLQNNSVLSDVEYDPKTDFTFLGVLTVDPVVLAVAPDSEHTTLEQLVEAAKADPSRVSIGATGVGSVDYLIALSIERAAGVEFGIVNFDSTTEGVVAVLSGSLDAMGMTVSSVIPFVQSGQLKVLAAGQDERIPELGDVPTFGEGGVQLLAEGSIRALLAPAGLPDDVRQKLVDAIKAAIEDPEFAEQAKTAGLRIVYMTPDEEKALSDRLVDSAQEYLKK